MSLDLNSIVSMYTPKSFDPYKPPEGATGFPGLPDAADIYDPSKFTVNPVMSSGFLEKIQNYIQSFISWFMQTYFSSEEFSALYNPATGPASHSGPGYSGGPGHSSTRGSSNPHGSTLFADPSAIGSNGGTKLGSSLTFQAGGSDSVRSVSLDGRQNVQMVDFKQGKFTTHSTSPRAELKVNRNLREGGKYSFKFGFKRDKNTDTTFFQVLDHNGSKPAPRAWLSVKNNQYVLHLREGSGASARVNTYNLGKATPGKWDDIQIDFNRGLNNGAIAVSINGKTAFSKSGISTMFDTHSGDAYAKYGQYRNQGDRSPGAVYFSDFTMSGG